MSVRAAIITISLVSATFAQATPISQPIVINTLSNWSKVEVVNYYNPDVVCGNKVPLTKGERWVITPEQLNTYDQCNTDGTFGFKFYGNVNRANAYLANDPVKPGQTCTAKFSFLYQPLVFNC